MFLGSLYAKKSNFLMKKLKVVVGLGSCGIAAGAGKVYEKLKIIKETAKIPIDVAKTSCVGMCFREPLLEIHDADEKYLYGEVDETIAEEIVNHHLESHKPLLKYLVFSEKIKLPDSVFFEEQIKIALRNCGHINPEEISEYEANNGYKAIKKIVENSISPENVILEILKSGLRGRGGGGFSTGQKWKYAAENKNSPKYIICNADEGDPGAFMDRSLLEGDPHAVLEGMLIAAYAIGANEGIIYCRAEYPLAIKRLNIAIHQARSKRYLGNHLFGIENFNFNISVKEGAGAFVCGEETALMASIEGKRGMPTKRPPFPAESGLWKKPSNINNVETFANVPWIIFNGAEKYSVYGTENSKGTKVFALTGKIKNGGLVEVPMGITINDIVYKLGGGIKGGKKLKAVQLGGPSGGSIPAYLCNTPIDYDSLKATGAIMGSGGLVVMDEATCMVDMARFFLDFTQKESCGKCTFCRIGTKRMLEILNRITQGEGKASDIETLLQLAEQIKDGSLCGLGQTAPNPVITAIQYFREEFENHIVHKKCSALVCTKLLTYTVVNEACTGCTVCAKNCPSNAISGGRKEIHFIDQEKCIKCGICVTKCNFDAIVVS